LRAACGGPPEASTGEQDEATLGKREEAVDDWRLFGILPRRGLGNQLLAAELLLFLQVRTQQTCQLVRLAPCIFLGIPDQFAVTVAIDPQVPADH